LSFRLLHFFMRRTLLKSKLHRATVTDANLAYEGSISIDPKLCELADLHAFESVDVYNITNGNRLRTYVILGGPGEITLNGAAAHLFSTGDEVIIASYAEYDDGPEVEAHIPKLIFVDGANQVKRTEGV